MQLYRKIFVANTGMILLASEKELDNLMDYHLMIVHDKHKYHLTYDAHKPVTLDSSGIVMIGNYVLDLDGISEYGAREIVAWKTGGEKTSIKL